METSEETSGDSAEFHLPRVAVSLSKISPCSLRGMLLSFDSDRAPLEAITFRSTAIELSNLNHNHFDGVVG